MAKKLEEGQIVLCNITKIVGTIVFAHLEDYNQEGTITFAEIFPGKIRNIRDFVFPGKKVVCKVLRISPHVIELSLRRVKVNERNDFNELHKKEKSYSALFKTILGEKESQEVIKKIKEEQDNFFEYVEEAKEDPKLLEKYIKKELTEKILTILKEKKAKDTIITKRFLLSSKSPRGIVSIKEIIKESSEEMKGEDISITYIAAGKYIIKIKTKDPKHTDQKLRAMIEKIETLSKKKSCNFLEEKD